MGSQQNLLHVSDFILMIIRTDHLNFIKGQRLGINFINAHSPGRCGQIKIGRFQHQLPINRRRYRPADRHNLPAPFLIHIRFG